MPGFRPRSVTIHPDVDAEYAAIEESALAGRQPETAIWKGFLATVAKVKSDGQWGEVIPRARIPARFVRAYGVTNLYCVDLAGFRRAFYTILGRDVVFLDVVDHARYDKWFGGRGK